MSHHYIQFNDVRFAYPGGPEILHGITCRVTHGEHVALLGLNGSGKSTMLLQTNGLLMPTSGEVVIGDVPVVKKTLGIIRQTVGMVFQNPDDMLFMPTIGEDIAFGPINMNLPEQEVCRRVQTSLRQVDLQGMENRPAFTLSGGQRRAAAIASVFSMEPSILVLDEPSANLDARARRQLIDILKKFSHTVIVATHDIEMALELCPRSIVLDAGNIIADGATSEVVLSPEYQTTFCSSRLWSPVSSGTPGL